MKKGIIIAILFCSIITCNKVKADTIKNVFMQDMREKSTNTQLGWDNNFRTYTLQWSANTNDASGTYTIVSDNNVLPILNGKRPYKLQYQIRIDNNNNNENAIANNNDFNMILTGLSINSFPVWTKEDGTGAGGGLCEVNQSYNNALEKFLTITCNITEDTYKLNELRIMWYWTGGTYNSTNFIRIGVSTNFNYIYDDGVSTQIKEQTQDILEANTTYNNDSEDITNQTQDFQDYEEEEQNILDSLDFSGIENITIGGSTNARTFIWDIVDRIRSMSNYIVLLMTSVLGMGLIKMVLNR